MSVIDDCKSIVATWENHPNLMEHTQDEYDLRKSLIEYDQALREALSALEQYGSKKYLSQNIANNVIDKYSHLLKGE